MGEDFNKKRQRNASGESTISNDSISHYIPTPPDGGYGWVIVLASFLNHVIVDGMTFTFGVFYLEFLDYFKEGKSKTALVGSLLCGFYMMTGPIASALVNRFGCRPVCVAGSLISGSAFALSTLSPNITVLMLTYGVMGGFGFCLIYFPSIISVSYYFEKRRAFATGIAVCGAGVGGFIFAPLGRWMLSVLSWKEGLLAVSAVLSVCTLCGCLMRPLEPKRRKPRQKNLFDRFKEKLCSSQSEQPEESEQTQNSDSDIAKAVEEAKLMREQRLKDEEDESWGGSPPISRQNSLVQPISRENSFLPSMTSLKDARKNSNTNQSDLEIPQIKILGASSDLPPHYEDVASSDEKEQMLKESKSDSRLESLENQGQSQPLQTSKSSEALKQNRILINNEELTQSRRESNLSAGPNSGHRDSNVSASAIPPHMRKYMGDAPPPGILKTQTSLPEGKPLLRFDEKFSRPLLSAEESGMKSISVSDVLALGVSRQRVKRPLDVNKEDFARPLYRRDIFYSGSILQVPQFRSQPDVKQYVASITTIPTSLAGDNDKCIWKCLPIPKVAKDILIQMMDFSLLMNPVFLIICLAEMFGFMGLFVPYIFLVERSIHYGVPESNAAFLLSVIGITNTVGRVIAGLLADIPQINSLLLHNVMMILGGVACILNMFATGYISMVIFALFFGLCVATYISLTSVILCNLMGLEKLTSAFGFLTMVRGVASIAGPPAAGWIFDLTDNYDLSFHVGGVTFIIAGLLYCLLHLPVFTRRSRNLALQHVMQEEDTNLPDVPVTKATASTVDICDKVSLVKDDVVAMETGDSAQNADGEMSTKSGPVEERDNAQNSETARSD